MRKSSILILLLLVTSLTLCLSTNKAYAYNNEEGDIGVLSENINSLEVEPIVIETFIIVLINKIASIYIIGVTPLVLRLGCTSLYF